MPRRLIATSLAVALSLSAGAFAALPAAAAEPQAPAEPAATAPAPAVAVQDGLRLEAKPVAPSFEAGKVAIIEATATNTSQSTLQYWLPTPCDSPFQVTVTTPDGASVRLPKEADLGKGQTFCIQVVKQLELAPGSSVSERFAWDTGAANAKPGAYTVTVAFNAHSETDAPNAQVSFALPLTGAGSSQSDGSGTDRTPGDVLPTGGKTLSDIQGHWAYDDILKGVAAGFVNGYPGGEFRPQKPVTVAEFLKMLVKARGLNIKTTPAPSFTDVAGHWVETQGYLEAAVEAGFLHPEDYAGVLNPNEPLNREDAAKLVVRAMAQEASALMANPSVLPFIDRDELGRWGKGFVTIAWGDKVINGYEDQTFQPKRPVTRAEAVAMLLRMVSAMTLTTQTANLKVDDVIVQTVPIAVMERWNRYQAPLSALAAATGIQVKEGAEGWYTLTRGDRTIQIKVGVPYLIDSTGARHDLPVDPPSLVDGQIFVPEGIFYYLGLQGNWDWAGSFRVFTHL